MIVLIAITEKQVVITDQYNTAPITGRQAIFARVQAPTEMRADFEIVGVYSDLERAQSAREAHAAAHPGRKYKQKVCSLDDATDTSLPAEEPKCIRCGGVPSPGMSYCWACVEAHNREIADRDDDPATAPEPVRRTTFQRDKQFNDHMARLALEG